MEGGLLMEHIIHQLVIEFTEKLMGEAENFATMGIGETTERMLGLCKGHAASMAVAMIEQMDAALRAEKTQRNADGLVVHERGVPRSPLTSIGPLPYRRTCFKDKDTGKPVYLLDHLIGVKGYERVCAHLSAKLVQEAGSASYARSSQSITDGAVSRQTVRNKLMRTGELAYVPERKAKTPETLHIFADEDHVPMQDGRSQNVNLVTVTEGSRKVCEGRNELVEAMHVQGYKVKPEDHWQYVAALCGQKYDMGKVEQVCIHGDGAAWIKSGAEYFANAFHVLDGYHLNKYMRKLTAGPICERHGGALWKTIKDDDRAAFEGIVGEVAVELERAGAEGVTTKKAKSVREAGAYILANWDAVQKRMDKDMQGSCTEGLISHVLSDRLSRTPMGWSEPGLSQMAMIRVFIKNGMVISEANIKSRPRIEGRMVPRHIEKYQGIVERQGKELLSKKRDWSIFEKSSFTMGLVTGTRQAYASLAKIRTAI
jgi:hypothetical protein